MNLKKQNAVKIENKKINLILSFLKKQKLIDNNLKLIKEDDSITVPLKKLTEEDEKLIKEKDIIIIQDNFEEKEKNINFKEEVLKILTDEESEKLKTAYDLVGEIAILEIEDILLPKRKQIGEILLKSNPSVTTVVRKKGAHEGELRLQKYEVIAGKDTLETIHKENSCKLKLILDQVYYSSRSATERKRIAKLVKDDENVLVMFSGAGPYPCVLSKNTNAKNIIGIELNEIGYKLSVETIKLNKIKNVDLIQGDVRQVCPELKEKGLTFDRIIMPLPKTAEEFLPEAFQVSKKGTIIHLYDFVDEREFPENVISKIKQYCDEFKLKYEILDSVKCGSFSPHIYRVCVDFKII